MLTIIKAFPNQTNREKTLFHYIYGFGRLRFCMAIHKSRLLCFYDYFFFLYIRLFSFPYIIMCKHNYSIEKEENIIFYVVF